MDIDGDQLFASIGVGPTHGTLKLDESGRFEYLPEAGYQGVDGFTYELTDGLATSSLATVTLNVGNRLPDLMLSQQYSVRHDTLLTKPWPSSDPDGDELVATVKTHPTHGTIEFDDHGTWTYSPNESYVGSDSFSFSLYDGLDESSDAVVAIDVFNHAPTGNADIFLVPHDRESVHSTPGVLANDADTDGDELTVTLVENMSHGRLELSQDGGFTYTPDPLFVGEDSFRYVVSDGIMSTDPIQVTIYVQERAPVADDFIKADWPHDQTLIGDLKQSTTDLDGDELVFTLETAPASGQLVFQANGEFAFSPAAGYTGLINFSYSAFDQILHSNVAQVWIEVVETAPALSSAAHAAVRHDTQLRRSVLASIQDPDFNEYLSAKLLSPPSYGEISFSSNGMYTYNPDPGFVSMDSSEWDSFTFQVSDGRGQTAVVTQTIDVFNSPPTTTADEYEMPHNRVLSAVINHYSASGVGLEGTMVASAPSKNDIDPDGDKLVYLLVDPLTEQPVTASSLGLPGELIWNEEGTFSFTPQARLTPTLNFTMQRPME